MRTDASGKVSYVFPVKKDRDTRVILSAIDDKGRETRAEAYMYGPPPPDISAVGQIMDRTPHLLFKTNTEPYMDYGFFHEGDDMNAQYVHGTVPVQIAKTPGILYITASRGIKKAEVVQSADYHGTFDSAFTPNASLVATTFIDGHFETVNASVSLKTDNKDLTVEAKADQESYAPGSNITVHVVVKNRVSGQRVPNVKVALSAIDKALNAVTYLTPEVPMNILYSYVPDGLLIQQRSRMSPAEAMMSNGGAEKGGGGGGDMNGIRVRRTFKDTAAFIVVDADQNGEANIVFKAPDNLTTWYTQAVAVSGDLQAGAALIDIPVKKNVFVDVVAPPRLLTQDKPVIKLRAYGSAVQKGTPVSFVVDAPTLGIQNQSVSGTADEPIYVSVEKLIAGTHKLRFSVTTAAGTDAMEREIVIDDSKYQKDELVSVDAVPGVGLPDLGVPQTDVYLTSKERVSYLYNVRDLVWGEGSARVDAKVAGRQMIRLLNSAFSAKETTPTDALGTVYQDYGGGIRLLPYSSPELELTSEIAATSLEGFDKNLLSSYFWSVSDNRKASREEQIQAMSGLAALGEPILPSLQAMAAQKELTWREQLAIARGMVAVGDLEAARSILDQLLQKAQDRNNLTSLLVSKNDTENYEATADAAALAASLAHPKASALRAYIDANWKADAFPVLARARYLQTVVPLMSDISSSVSWSIGGQPEQTAQFKDTPTEMLTLTAAEAKNFRVTKAVGRVAISYVRRIAGRPSSVPEVAISRSYASDRPMNQLQEGDLVRITLTPAWQPSAQEGCYAIHDHLPGGWQAVVNWSLATQGSTAYPYDVQDGEVSFVTCKSDNLRPITYLGRVVSRGTYTAEAVSMQNMQYPSVAAIGKDETVIVK